MSDPARSSQPAARQSEAGRSAVSIGVSAALHVALLAVLGMVSWVVLRAPEQKVVVSLTGTSDASGGSGGELGAPSRIAAPQSPAAAQQSTAAAAAQVPVPAPTSVAPAIAPSPALHELAPAGGALDPVMSVFAPAGNPGVGGPGAQTNRGGPGVGQGVGPGLGDVLGNMRRRGLDVVFVIDATASMGPYIGQAKTRLRDIVSVVSNLVAGDKPDAVRFGLVAFKDYGDDYGIDATRTLPLTAELADLQKALDEVVAGGGADVPEPLHDALRAAFDRRMGWDRRRLGVVIMVTDAPCHSLGRAAAARETQKFAKSMSASVNAIDVGGTADGRRVRETALEDLVNITAAGGGSAFLLGDEQAFWRHLIVSIFGQRYENDVQQIIDRYVGSGK